MSGAFIFSILFLIGTVYAALGGFLNWESSKKSWAKGKPSTFFDKFLGIILVLASICFFILVLIKGY